MTSKQKAKIEQKIQDLKIDLEFESRSGNFRIAREIDQLICKLEKDLAEAVNS
tara:strand:- start:322 stop:480 length:159 start_codon:yes stop_codon:yes gene_type:complete